MQLILLEKIANLGNLGAPARPGSPNLGTDPSLFTPFGRKRKGKIFSEENLKLIFASSRVLCSAC